MNDGHISTWKQIGAFLGCSARSAKRKAKRGMPVYCDGSGVWAVKSEINRWRKQDTPKNHKSHLADAKNGG